MVAGIGSANISLNSQSSITKAFQSLQSALSATSTASDEKVDKALKEVVDYAASSGEIPSQKIADGMVSLLMAMESSSSSGGVKRAGSMLQDIIAGNQDFYAVPTDKQENEARVKKAKNQILQILKGGVENKLELMELVDLMGECPDAFDGLLKPVMEAIKNFAVDQISGMKDLDDIASFIDSLSSMANSIGDSQLGEMLQNLIQDPEIVFAVESAINQSSTEGSSTQLASALQRMSESKGASSSVLDRFTPLIQEAASSNDDDISVVPVNLSALKVPSGDSKTLLPTDKSVQSIKKEEGIQPTKTNPIVSGPRPLPVEGKPAAASLKAAALPPMLKDEAHVNFSGKDAKPELVKMELHHLREMQTTVKPSSKGQKTTLSSNKEPDHMVLAMAAQAFKSAKELGAKNRSGAGMGDFLKRPKASASALAKAIDDDPENSLSMLYCVLLNITHDRMEEAINRISF